MLSVGCPFAVRNVAIFGERETKFLVAFRKLVETAFSFVDLLDPVLSFGKPRLQCGSERFEPWVEIDDTCIGSARKL